MTGITVLEVGHPTRLTGSALVRTGAGRVMGVIVAAATGTPTMTLWDNTSAAGTQMTGAIPLIAGQYYPLGMRFATGLYVQLGGTVDCTVVYDEEP